MNQPQRALLARTVTARLEQLAWRMHVASGWLRNERLMVAEVAERLGYESEASFSRAFKRHLSVPPSALRRAVQSRADRTVLPRQ